MVARSHDGNVCIDWRFSVASIIAGVLAIIWAAAVVVSDTRACTSWIADNKSLPARVQALEADGKATAAWRERMETKIDRILESKAGKP